MVQCRRSKAISTGFMTMEPKRSWKCFRPAQAFREWPLQYVEGRDRLEVGCRAVIRQERLVGPRGRSSDLEEASPAFLRQDESFHRLTD